jgi:hypothetical protein
VNQQVALETVVGLAIRSPLQSFRTAAFLMCDPQLVVLGASAYVILDVFGPILVVDPYRLFHFPEIVGLSVLKPAVSQNARMTKAHEVRVMKPAGLVLGSSRAEYA